MLDKLSEIREYLAKHNLIFWYNGPISQILVGEVGDIIKKSIIEESGRKYVTKVFSIIVEVMQNIIKYSTEIVPVGKEGKETAMRAGSVAVGICDDNCFIMSGNQIHNEHIQKISEKLDLLSEMDRQAQKEYYKSLRRKEPHESSKGAGIGFVEMARKASEPIEYSFQKMDEDTSYFSLKILVQLTPQSVTTNG